MSSRRTAPSSAIASPTARCLGTPSAARSASRSSGATTTTRSGTIFSRSRSRATPWYGPATHWRDCSNGASPATQRRRWRGRSMYVNMRTMINLATWSRASAIIGGLAWLLLFGITLPGDTTTATIARLLLLAVLVVTPLALPLAAPPAGASRAALPHRAALLCQPFAAALVVLALLAPAGIPAALLASGWLLLSGLAALTGLLRFLSRRSARADEL